MKHFFASIVVSLQGFFSLGSFLNEGLSCLMIVWMSVWVSEWSMLPVTGLSPLVTGKSVCPSHLEVLEYKCKSSSSISSVLAYCSHSLLKWRPLTQRIYYSLTSQERNTLENRPILVASTLLLVTHFPRLNFTEMWFLQMYIVVWIIVTYIFRDISMARRKCLVLFLHLGMFYITYMWCSKILCLHFFIALVLYLQSSL